MEPPWTQSRSPPAGSQHKAIPPSRAPTDDISFNVRERNDFCIIANRSYENRNVAILDIGHAATLTDAEKEIQVRMIVRAISSGWDNQTTDYNKMQTLLHLMLRYENDMLTLPDWAWPHEGNMATARMTAIGIMASELPVALQQYFRVSQIIWSRQGRILNTWFSVRRAISDRGLAIDPIPGHDANRRAVNVVDT